MTSSQISNLPVIKVFVTELIKIAKSRKFFYQPREIINTELIPRISGKLNSNYIISLDIGSEKHEKQFEIHQPQQIHPPQQIYPPQQKKQIMQTSYQRAPAAKIIKIMPRQIQQITQITNSAQGKPYPAMHPPQTFQTEIKEDYGKITALLKDPSISSIECSGPDKNITIIRAGMKQLTKITLNPVEIKQFLEKVASIAKVPLIEGVFRAAVENFVINAVVSEIIGSRFTIKKQTPYALLER